jgi:hypothetical protein
VNGPPSVDPGPSGRSCLICFAPSKPHSIYCPICWNLVTSQPEGRARVAALIRARRPDGFHCEYSGALLNRTDPGDPFYIVFDHRIPRNKGDLAATGCIINESKGAMSHLEFPIVVHGTVRHWDTGEPFRKDIVPFAYWSRGKHALRATNARLVDMALGPRLLDAGLLRPGLPGAGLLHPGLHDAGLLRPATGGNLCPICERYATVGKHKYCLRCGKIVRGTPGASIGALEAAMHKAYNHDLDAFIDYHLGVVLDLYDWTSPFYPCFDHLTPGKRDDVVFTSNLANTMKKDTDEEEFHAYFRMLDGAMQGGTFDKTGLQFKYWKSYGRHVA